MSDYQKAVKKMADLMEQEEAKGYQRGWAAARDHYLKILNNKVCDKCGELIDIQTQIYAKVPWGPTESYHFCERCLSVLRNFIEKNQWTKSSSNT